MTVRSDGTNAPLHSREKKAKERLERLVERHMAEGMSRHDAEQRARTEMRDNPRKDWRGG